MADCRQFFRINSQMQSIIGRTDISLTTTMSRLTVSLIRWSIVLDIVGSATCLQAQSVVKPIRTTTSAYSNIPAGFEKNEGQFVPDVQFAVRNPGFTLALTQNEAWMSADGAVASLHFLGASADAKLAGLEPLASVSNYLIGNDPSRWRRGIRQYGKVVATRIYPGIDAVYYGDGRTLEFDLNVHPGADPSMIRLAYDGVAGLRVTAEGDVSFTLGDREIVQRKPVAYQERENRRVPISANYRIAPGGNEVVFEVGPYDRSRPLILDPILEYGTFLGGTGLDGANALAVDSSGNAYIAGYTQSANLPKPASSPIHGALAGPGDAFVAKINATGTALVYTTYLGGSGDDQGSSVAVDAAGNAYVSGVTNSADFPTLGAGGSNNLSATFGGGPADGFLSVLNSSGSSLIFSGYVGGPGNDVANALALDSSSNIYLTGYTNSTRFTGIGPASGQPSNAGGYDAFVIKLSKTGLILWGTFFGGSGDEAANGIAVDVAGNAYIVGGTTSPSLPLTGTPRRGSGHDAYLATFSAAGGSLRTVLESGGSSDQVAFGVAVDSSNIVYITGRTNSTDFPVAAPIQPTNGGGYDAFVIVLQPAVSSAFSACGCTITLSSYLGGSGTDAGYAIEVTRTGDIIVAGYTDSSNFLPSLPSRPGKGANTFVAKLSPSSAGLLGAIGSTGTASYSPSFAAFLGASDPNNPVSLALHAGVSLDDIFVAGYANAAFSFPASTAPPLFAYAGGPSDAFLAKLGQADLTVSLGTIGPYVGTNVPTSGSIVPGTTALIPFTISNSGPDSATNVITLVQLPPGVTFVRCQAGPLLGLAFGLSGAPVLEEQATPGSTSATCSVSGSTVTVFSSSLAAGSAITLQVLASVATSLNNTSPTIRATIQSATNDPNVGNNATANSFDVLGVQAFFVNPANLNFGSVQVGNNNTQTLVVMPGSQVVQVTLTLVPDSGISANVFSVNLGNPNFPLDKSPQSIPVVFQPDTSGPETGVLEIKGSTANQTQVVSISLQGLGSGPINVTTTKILPQLAFGGGWYTGLYFTNLNMTPVSFAVSFIGDDGNPLTVPGLGSSVTVSLPGRGTALVEAPNAGSLVQGYVSAPLPAGVTGFGVFRQSVPGVNDQEAVVPLSDTTAMTSTLVFDETKYTTGVAVANLSSTNNTISAIAHDKQGNIIGTGNISLGANAKQAVVLKQIPGLAGVAGMVGSVDFTVNTGNVAGLGLRFNGTAFTSIPASSANATATTKILPQLAFGGGWYTGLYFTNLNMTPVSFAVSFIGDDGNPLTIPGLGSSVTVNLSGRGTALVEAPNAGSLVQGYVSAALPTGVTGFGVFRQSVPGINDQEAVVPLSDITAMNSTLIFDETKYTTAIAVVKLSAANNTITAIAHDKQGNIIGTGNISLGANAKQAVVLKQIPGLAGVAGLAGSVDFTVNTGNVAGLGLRFNGAAFTSIPTSDR
jgi:hypothetical protein